MRGTYIVLNHLSVSVPPRETFSVIEPGDGDAGTDASQRGLAESDARRRWQVTSGVGAVVHGRSPDLLPGRALFAAAVA
jgi:hypothetical protein